MLQSIIRFSAIHFAVMEHFLRCFLLKSDSHSIFIFNLVSCVWEKLHRILTWILDFLCIFIIAFYLNASEILLVMCDIFLWFLKAFWIVLFLFGLTQKVFFFLSFFSDITIHSNCIYLAVSYLSKEVFIPFASTTLHSNLLRGVNPFLDHE